MTPARALASRAGSTGSRCRWAGSRVLVFDEVAKTHILLVADRRLDGERLPGKLEDFPHLLHWHAELFGKLLGRRLATDLVEHLARRAHDLVDGLDHVHGNADSARLVGD